MQHDYLSGTGIRHIDDIRNTEADGSFVIKTSTIKPFGSLTNEHRLPWKGGWALKCLNERALALSNVNAN